MGPIKGKVIDFELWAESTRTLLSRSNGKNSIMRWKIEILERFYTRKTFQKTSKPLYDSFLGLNSFLVTVILVLP